MSTSGVGYEQLNAPLKAMINSGGGGTGGSGGSFIVVPQFSTVKLTQASNTVNTNLSNFNKDFDTLLTFKNSVYIGQRDSYNIISNTQIQSSDKSNWEAGTTFQFVGLCVNRAPNVLICISIKNKVELTTSSSFIDIGVRDFDQDADTLLLFENGVYMEKGLDYRIDGSKVYPIGDTLYKGTTDCPLIFNMIVLRNVVDPDAVKDFEGSNIKDLTITMNKLSQDIQNILNNPQDKRVGNMSLLKTSSKDTLVNSINELFQSASNGKTLVANAITGKGVQSNSNMTFQQLATNISNIKTGSYELVEGELNIDNGYLIKRFYSDSDDGYDYFFKLPEFENKPHSVIIKGVGKEVSNSSPLSPGPESDIFITINDNIITFNSVRYTYNSSQSSGSGYKTTSSEIENLTTEGNWINIGIGRGKYNSNKRKYKCDSIVDDKLYYEAFVPTK